MKLYLLMIVLVTQLFSLASLEHVSMNDYDFSIVSESYDVYDSKGTVMKMYREERNKNLTFVLRLTLKDATGGCSSKSLEDGAYDINASVITLYTRWSRRGKAYEAPEGVRIQRFEVQSDGSLKQIFGKLYIETTRKRYADESGMEYLFIPAQTDEEKKQFSNYIKSVEKQYQGVFVFGDESKALIKEVKQALKKKVKASWKIR